MTQHNTDKTTSDLAVDSVSAVSAERFVAEYQMLNMGWLEDEHKPTTGMCATCEYRRDGCYGSDLSGTDDDEDLMDWCYLYAGAFMDGSEHKCPAWISSQNA